MNPPKKLISLILALSTFAMLMPFPSVAATAYTAQEPGSVASKKAASTAATSDVGLQQLLRGFNVLSGAELKNTTTNNTLFKTTASNALTNHYEFVQAKETDARTFSGKSMTEFAESAGLSLATSASADVSVGKLFKASASAKFGMENTSAYKEGYESYFYQFIINRLEGKNAIKDINSPTTKKALEQELNPEFLKALLGSSNIERDIFGKYGTHFITSYGMGGWSEFTLSTVITKKDVSSTKQNEYGTSVSASGGAFGVTAGASATVDLKTKSSSAFTSEEAKTQTKSKTFGGSGGVTFSDNPANIQNTYNAWLNTFKISGPDANCYVLMDENLQLTGIWELLPDGYEARKRELRAKYIELSVNQDKGFYNEFVYKSIKGDSDYKAIPVDEFAGNPVPSTNAIRITSASDFLNIGYAGFPLNGNYVLTQDIDLGTFTDSNFSMAGKTFTGTFDGNGKSIKVNFNLTATQNVTDFNLGLFPKNTGTIKNLTVKDSRFYYYNANRLNIGAGTHCYYRSGAIAGHNSGVIENCRVVDSEIYLNPTLYANSGGQTAVDVYCGGIAGQNTGTIRKCSVVNAVADSNTATVEARSNMENPAYGFTGYSLAGGIVGLHAAGNVIDCYFDAQGVTTVINVNSNVYLSKPNLYMFSGGIAGEAYNSAKITRCFSNGWEWSDYKVTFGAGLNFASEITQYHGGMIGRNGAGACMTDCFYLTGSGRNPAVGNGNNTGATGLSSYKDSAIVNKLTANGWVYVSTDKYPKLDTSNPLEAFQVYYSNKGKPDFPQFGEVQNLSKLMTVYLSGITDITNDVQLRYNFSDAGNQEIQFLYKDGDTTYTGSLPVTVKALSLNSGATTVTGVAIVPAAASVKKGATAQFAATVTGANYPAQTVKWSVTGNTSKSTVISTSGRLTVGADEKAATLTVTATSTVNTGKKATAKVTVKNADISLVTGVTLSKKSTTLAAGANETLTAKVAPATATNKAVTWSSSNTSIATVSSTGVIKGIKAGTAKITVKTKDGGKTATCAVAVQQYVTLRVGYPKAIQNGIKTTIDKAGTKPVKIGGRTVLPIRFVSEKMGAKVTYVNDKTPITIVYGSKTVKFTLGSKKMTVTENGKSRPVTLDVVAQKKKGKTFIPLRAIGEVLGFDVFYDSKTEIIVVNNPKMTAAIRTARVNEAKAYIK